MDFIKNFLSLFKERYSKKRKAEYNEKSSLSDYSYVQTVPWNLNLEDFRHEYDNLHPLIDAIRANVKIYDIDSRLQRILCINEILDVIESDTHYRRFTEQELLCLGEKYEHWSLHSDVYINKEKGIVYKSKNIFSHDRDKKHNPMDTIYEYLLHNILFPNTKLHLEGISTREGEPTLVFSQPYINGTRHALEGEKMKYMSLLGLTKSNYGDFGNDYFTIHRVHSTTTFSIRGNLYFIDPVILFNKPPLNVFKYLLNKSNN